MVDRGVKVVIIAIREAGAQLNLLRQFIIDIDGVAVVGLADQRSRKDIRTDAIQGQIVISSGNPIGRIQRHGQRAARGETKIAAQGIARVFQATELGLIEVNVAAFCREA